MTKPSAFSATLTSTGFTTYNAANNSFYIDSGRGFTRNNVVAPDFAAPGVDVPRTTDTIKK